MNTISIIVPDALLAQKLELESAIARIAAEEAKLAAQRKELHAALNTIATGIKVLSGKLLPTNMPWTGTIRKPMSEDAKKRIAEGLRKSREHKAKAAHVVVSVPNAPAESQARVTRREPRAPRKPVRIQ